jgi:hypothetical protein
VRIKQPETTVTQEKSHEDLRGTKQSPLIIEVAPTTKTDAERAEETKERERITELERNKDKSDSDIVRYTGELAFFTKGLFAATVALVLATIGLGVAAVVQSLDLKKSFNLARDEFISTHRPRIVIRQIAIWNKKAYQKFLEGEPFRFVPAEKIDGHFVLGKYR